MALLWICILSTVLFLIHHLIHFLHQAHVNPALITVPGPFLARFTRLWYFTQVWKGHFEIDNLALHARYGPIVRLAPGHYSISRLEDVNTVYKNGRFPKAAWYEGFKHPSPERWSLFPDRNIQRHAETRKRFTALYSMSSLRHYEGFVDDCANIFSQRLHELAASGQSIDLHHWLQCYAFDVVGFLDEGKDIEGAIDALQKLLTYAGLIGIFPEWHPRLYDPLDRLRSSGPNSRSYIISFVEEKVRQLNKTVGRHNELQQDDNKPGNTKGITAATIPQDFMKRMAGERAQDPDKVNDFHMTMMGVSNVIAGSDTTAISLSAIIYYLLQNPPALSRLRKEISNHSTTSETDRHSNSHATYHPPVTLQESQAMPYLQAVITEALRMHTATGLPLWREVPAGGTQLGDYFFPEGSVLGINAWVAHYDERIFPDAHSFRPERWLEKEGGSESLQTISRMYMPFGLGSRTCLGKNIAILEMSKLIPQLLRDFDFELEKKDQTWTTKNFWFVKPVDFRVKVHLRAKEERKK